MKLIPTILTLCIMMFIAFLCFKKSISLSKSRKKMKSNSIKKESIVIGMYNHISGLQLAENTSCRLFIHDDKILIEGQGIKFNLYKEKILDVCIKTETEIQKQYVSSIGGAIAGGVMFGTLGAIIGGRVKEKKSKGTTKYLIYTYKKDDTIDYISFDILNGINSHKFLSDFANNSNKNITEINL